LWEPALHDLTAEEARLREEPKVEVTPAA
jgi:hypothetical protein